MKVVILAGGQGTRLPEYTKKIPKPMVKVASHPIIFHIIKHYLKYNLNKFIIATGYKGHVFEEYFKSYKKMENHFLQKYLKNVKLLY